LNEAAVPPGKRPSLVDALKYADWLTAERVRLWATCFAVAWLFVLLVDAWAHSSLGVMDDKGEHIGRESGAISSTTGRVRNWPSTAKRQRPITSTPSTNSSNRWWERLLNGRCTATRPS
jgi:hypothetical protein